MILKRKKALVSVFTAVILNLSVCNFAFAIPTDSQSTSINNNSDFCTYQEVEPLTPEMQKKSDEKIKEAEQYVKSHSIVDTNSGAFIPQYATWGSVPIVLMTNQPNPYTCGPQTAHNLLTDWAVLVDEKTLETDLGYNGQTGLGPLWTTTLNKYIGSSFYVLTMNPNQTTLWNSYLVDIGSVGKPFVLDAYMSPTTGYMVGYASWASGRAVLHYTTATGYTTSSANNAYYFDSYNFHTGCYGAHYMEISSLTPMISALGIVW